MFVGTYHDGLCAIVVVYGELASIKALSLEIGCQIASPIEEENSLQG